MQARDIMTTSVVTVGPDTNVRDIARRLIERRISAVPVVDVKGRVLGIVSEGDLMRRPESETERLPPWWLRLLASPQESAGEYVKTHGLVARDVMTENVISASEHASLEEIATTLEKRRIKRVPILRDGKLVGIVSRANLLHGLVARAAAPSASATDAEIRAALDKTLKQAGVNTTFLNIVVSGAVVHLWGGVESEAEKQAARIAAERMSGVKRVEDRIGVFPEIARAVLWAE